MTDPFQRVFANEVLSVCFQQKELPHQILGFCLRRTSRLTPAQIVSKFADPAQPCPLDQIADFVAVECGRYCISPYRLRAMMQPLRTRLRLPLSEAVTEPQWRAAHEGLLEVHGREICGTTSLRLYDSGRIIEQLSLGNARESADCVQPVEYLGHALRRVLGLSYSWGLERMDLPLGEIAEQMECLIACSAASHMEISPLLAHLRLNTKLREYETSHLAADISRWVYRFDRKLNALCR